MKQLTEFLKVNAKAVAGFVAGIILTAVQKVISGEVPWPKTLAEWAQYLGTALVSGVVVWATGNKLTEKQIVKSAVQQGITVIAPAAIDYTAGVVNDKVQDVTQALLPDAAAKPIVEVAQATSNTVVNVLKGLASNFPAVSPRK